MMLLNRFMLCRGVRTASKELSSVITAAGMHNRSISRTFDLRIFLNGYRELVQKEQFFVAVEKDPRMESVMHIDLL